LILLGLVSLHDAPHWGRDGYVGNAQYGDAEFWWNGALHFSQGIVAENPNLHYRMGYAAFAGTLAAVLGSDYRVFHLLLLAVFLALAVWLYLGLRRTSGRLVAAVVTVGLVFNPYTAEFLAISTSDGLGLLFNLAALLALLAALRQADVHLGWLAAFGVLFACNSLTRPLMTPFIAAAALAVGAQLWGRWRRTWQAWAVLVGAFLAPTLAWMAFMGATTGNFALTGEGQDASAFYAASDPQIQVWRPDMYDAVRDSARSRLHTQNLTSAQMNAEFWTLTRKNYVKHWRFHWARLGRHILVLSQTTPDQATMASPAWRWERQGLKVLLAAILCVVGWRQGRHVRAALAAGLALTWAGWSGSQPWLLLVAGLLGCIHLFRAQRALFIWSSYWLVGAFALYLTGGTWGPPLSPTHEINALGYRLGFQFFFANDLIIILSLAWLAGGPLVPSSARVWRGLTGPAEGAQHALHLARLLAGAVLVGLLLWGGVLVAARLHARAQTQPVPYPALSLLQTEPGLAAAQPISELTALLVAINRHDGTRLLTQAGSAGFVWNLPGQQRAVLLLYQQDRLTPVQLHPRQFYAEVPQHLPVAPWLYRQGAWLLRSFPDAAPAHNQAYYVNNAAVQAFIPVTADGRTYAVAQRVDFPLALYATQLVGARLLTFTGMAQEWSTNSGREKYPRRFSARATGPDGSVGVLRFDLSRARGHRQLSFGVQLESVQGRPISAALRLVGDSAATPMWQTRLSSPDGSVTRLQLPLPDDLSALRLECDLPPGGHTLWFNELVLSADDFTP
jgi:hypothetical protein